VNIGTIRRNSMDVDTTDQGSVDVVVDMADQGSAGIVDAAGRGPVNADVGVSDPTDMVAEDLAFSRKRIIS
jgi:hypothetical protein